MRWVMMASMLMLWSGKWAAGAPIYFLVAEPRPFHNDSYVLPLEGPADIAHARDLIVRGPSAGRNIVVADIIKGADGINGDYVEPEVRLWSWQVSRFRGFADITAEILDGWPTGVEMGIDQWTDGNPRTIGFWAYTVKAELGPNVPEPGMGMMVMAGSLMLMRRRSGMGAKRSKERRKRGAKSRKRPIISGEQGLWRCFGRQGFGV